jgi:hypothetical protein
MSGLRLIVCVGLITKIPSRPHARSSRSFDIAPIVGRLGGSKRKIRESTRDVDENSLLDQAPGPSSTPPKGCGRGSVRKKAV